MRLVLTLLLMLAAVPAWAGPMEDAAAAYARGDHATELGILRPLAAAGEAWAQYQLGSRSYFGEGVPRDYEDAVKWFRLAAAQGYAPAQYSLGVSYNLGEGISQDYVEGFRWYRLAAQQGTAQAQVGLGMMYYRGEGVRQDPVRALMWITIASDAGNFTAARTRNWVARVLSTEQVAEAERLARECQARNCRDCD